MNVIALSLARNTLDDQSRERARMCSYARKLTSYHVVVLTRRRHGHDLPVCEGNLSLYPTNTKTRVGMLLRAYLLVRQILKKHPDEHFVLTSQDPFELGILGRLFADHPRVTHHVQVHGDFYGSDRWRNESFMNKVRHWIGLRVLGSAPCIRVVSKRAKEGLVARGIPESRIAVLPIWSDLSSFVPDAGSTGSRAELTVLYVGRLAREKNIGMLISAFAEVHTEHPDTRLHIVGKGPEREALEVRVRRYKIESVVTFTDWTEDVPAVMHTADVFAFTSDHEGYALVLAEALAAGLPIVTTDVGCTGELVIDGVHGRVVPPRDTETFTKALREIVSSEKARMTYREHAAHTGAELAAYTEAEYVDAWVAALKQCPKAL